MVQTEVSKMEIHESSGRWTTYAPSNTHVNTHVMLLIDKTRYENVLNVLQLDSEEAI